MGNIKRNKNDYVIFYKTKESKYRIYDLYTETFITGEYPRDRYCFALMTGYKTTDEGLIEYSKDFNKWNGEQELYNMEMKIKLRPYYDNYNDYLSVSNTFNNFCKYKYKCHEQITYIESSWIDKCYNTGLHYLKEDNIIKEGYGYDYSKCYVRVMHSDLEIPINTGKEYKLTQLYGKLANGYYRVKITCDNDKFKKIFSFSHHNVYLNLSLDFAMKHQKKYKVNIELIVDGKPNAFLYADKCMRKISTITKDWFDYLIDIGKRYPKNKLIKFLGSSCWGVLSQSNELRKTEQEIIDEKIDVGDHTHDYDIVEEVFTKSKSYYVLQSNVQPYKFNIRLKPFVTAYARIMIANLAIPNLRNIYRVYCDNLVSKKPLIFDDPFMVVESKTTGIIHWLHNTNYKSIDDPDYDDWLSRNKLSKL